MSDSTVNQAGTNARPAGASKLAILASFVAGACAAWIFISLNSADDIAEPMSSAPTTSVAR
jgi:hypothetical protein